MWTAPAGSLACPPLPGPCLRPDALRLPNSRQRRKDENPPVLAWRNLTRPQVEEFEVAIRVMETTICVALVLISTVAPTTTY